MEYHTLDEGGKALSGEQLKHLQRQGPYCTLHPKASMLKNKDGKPYCARCVINEMKGRVMNRMSWERIG